MLKAFLAGAASALIVVALAGAIWWLTVPAPPVEPPPTETPPKKVAMRLEPASFADLAGWPVDDMTATLSAFRRSCAFIVQRPDDRAMGGEGYAGMVGDWREACEKTLAMNAPSPAAVRAFFEANFSLVRVISDEQPNGLFTGYYEPTLRGSRRRQGPFTVPLHVRPPDLVSVDLGLFRKEYRGRQIAGMVREGRLLPYHDRAAIDAGALDERAAALLFVDDPVDAFFLHIQGSGLIQLDDGSAVRVGYDGKNGHPYRSIGGLLLDAGLLRRNELSLETVSAWLRDHPDEAAKLMRRNPSYIFFRELTGPGPLGAEGTALTPGRSLAVDRKFHALGVPVWLDVDLPAGAGLGARLRRLFVAQDTGSAITGPIRGDLFWGHGEQAKRIAGALKQTGRMWVLLPKSVAVARPPSG